MKKIIFLLITFICIFSVLISVNAASNQYTINIPLTYSKVSDGYFKNSSNDIIYITVKPYTINESSPFSEEELNKVATNLVIDTTLYKKILKTELEKGIGIFYSRKDLEKDLKTFSCKSIDVKEIITCTKNNYKCFHLRATYNINIHFLYVEQYCFISNNNLYTINICSSDSGYAQSFEISDAIKTFTITDYSDPEIILVFPKGVWIAIACVLLVVVAVLAVRLYISFGKDDPEDINLNNRNDLN